MTHTYNISGITCGSCEKKIDGLISKVKGVKKVRFIPGRGQADIEMDHHIATPEFQAALADYPAYQLTEASVTMPVFSGDFTEEKKSWLATYKPILLIFAYITTISLAATFTNGIFNPLLAMRIFMAGFFITFSFFKMLDLAGFADSYAMYDIIAKKYRPWGYIYAFVELGLGLAYATNFQPFIVNYITLVVMSVSIIGVLQSVMNKRKIKCACLGAVFNLPMSTITVVEDSLMIAMSAVMIVVMS
jgi:copper chaperone CopZ